MNIIEFSYETAVVIVEYACVWIHNGTQRESSSIAAFLSLEEDPM